MLFRKAPSDLFIKKGVPALTSNQPEEGLQVLRERAREMQVCILLSTSLVTHASLGIGLPRSPFYAWAFRIEARYVLSLNSP